ncbi:unnamed protein product [Microthlaspi erraticum]|uniref:Uncharacterized protein n=1 Tax=Microthlaspi erraticum TaxID=1685480 RepID=A0A6D2JBW0_9BRAS|nr:unnamed protein product [Microthlaspi erraticum]
MRVWLDSLLGLNSACLLYRGRVRLAFFAEVGLGLSFLRGGARLGISGTKLVRLILFVVLRDWARLFQCLGIFYSTCRTYEMSSVYLPFSKEESLRAWTRLGY